jgi:hypothetical protein
MSGRYVNDFMNAGGVPPIHCIAPVSDIRIRIHKRKLKHTGRYEALYGRVENFKASDVRKWAILNGFPQLATRRGRLPNDVLIAWQKTHGDLNDNSNEPVLSWGATLCSRWASVGALYCTAHNSVQPNIVNTGTTSYYVNKGSIGVNRNNGFDRIRCSSTTHSGRHCAAWAVKGGTTCNNHGGTRRRNVTETRVTLAQLLRADPRPIWMILLDAVATADSLLLHAREEIMNSPIDEDGNITLDPDNYLRLMEATDRAAKLSKVAIDANISERMTQQFEAEGKLLATALNAALDAVLPGLKLTPDQELEYRHKALQAGQKNLLNTMKRDERAYADKRDETSTKLLTQIEDLRASAREEYAGGAVIDMDE